MSTALNKHKDHIASCWCCRHLIIEEGFSYSEQTDEPDSVSCARQVFKQKWSPDQNDLHELYLIGQTCDRFEEVKG